MFSKLIRAGVVSAAAIAFASPALAEDANYSVGLTAGTLGVGPEVGVRIGKMFGVRGNATFLGVSHDVDVEDINYAGKLKLGSFGVNADVYPLGGGFRLSAGLRVNKNKVNLDATPTQSVEVGNNVYTPAQIGTLSGTIRTSDVTPTLTAGFAGGLTKGIRFGVDAGVMFQGKPHVRDLKATGLLASNAAFQADLVREQGRIDDEVNKYKVYPVLQLSLFYAF